MPSANASRVDVLIIGAGPAGLMLSTWMARMGIKTRIIDKRFSTVTSGQADGLQSRTFEASIIHRRTCEFALIGCQILDSLGLGQEIWREANHMLEIRFWNPDERGSLYRSDQIVDTLPGLSRFQQATLHQGRIEDSLIKYNAKYSDIKVEGGIMPESLTIDIEKVENDEEYPISVTLQLLPKTDAELTSSDGSESNPIPNGLFRSNLTADTSELLLQNAKDSSESHQEIIQAKYVVGCDGAHSWTRRQIGSVLEGEQTDFIWGVLDIIPITSFPDIRYRCAIHSQHGSMMIIPREGKLVRMYIQVTEVDANGKAVDRFKISPQNLLTAAQKILAPYTLDYKHCSWWTAYRIGQRVGSKFSAHERVFLAGDAVHTHSPKAGQGMNISMHDTYNLGWKLATVVKGWANRSLLKTYSTERRQVAQDLIEFDQKFSHLFSGRPSKDTTDNEGIDLDTFKTVFEKGNLFASGCAVEYASNHIVAKPRAEGAIANGGEEVPGSKLFGKQSLATKIPIGMRIPSHKVLNQADARPWHLQELLPSNGTWRILVFAGNIHDSVQLSRYQALGRALSSEKSFLSKYTLAKGGELDSMIEIITIHSAPRKEVELLSLPDIFHPFSEEYGWDYHKVFVDDWSYHEGHGEAYKNYGIDRSTGCLVIVRPDQYVSWIGDLEDVEEMGQFFASFLRAQEGGGSSGEARGAAPVSSSASRDRGLGADVACDQ